MKQKAGDLPVERIGGGGGYLKTLTLAVLAGLTSSGAQAETLDIPGAPTLGNNSAYTLTETSQDTGSDNSILGYKYDPVTGELTPAYAEYNIKAGIQSHEKISTNENIYENVGTLSTPAHFINNTGTAIELSESTRESIDSPSGIRGTIKNLVGDFVHNERAISIDGAGYIGNITGDFIDNSDHAIYVDLYTFDYSGLLGIDKITGNFVNNSTDDKGGAIYYNSYIWPENNNLIINGNFVNNSSAEGGGAIYIYTYSNPDWTISGNFIGNHTSGSDTGGGAIALDNYSYLTISGSFIGNYAKRNGGAIYSCGTIFILADNDISRISGNYILDDSGNKDYQAIYLYGGELYLKPTNNGSIIIDDKIDSGAKTYNYDGLYINGDDTGTVSLFNDITGQIKTYVMSGNVNFSNSIIKDYTLYSLSSNAKAKYAIDVDLSGSSPVADTITVTQESSGIVTLDKIRFLSEPDPDKTYIVQILKGVNDTGSTLQLALSDKLGGLNIEDTVYDDDVIIASGDVALATTDSANDSIRIGKNLRYDNLAAISQKITTNLRQFVFNTDNTYTAGSTVVSAGELNIIGKEDGMSTIDFQNQNAFQLPNKTTLNITDTKLTNNNISKPLITVSNTNAIVNLQNVYLDGNVTGDLSSTFRMNINGDASDTTTLNGKLTHTYTTLYGGTLKINPYTFADTYDKLDVLGGTVALKDGTINDYIISGDFSSNTRANYTIDIDVAKKTADTLSLKKSGSYSSYVKISKINFIGEAPTDVFKVKVLNKSYSSNGTKLKLDPSLTGEVYRLGTETLTIDDTVNAVVNYKDEFRTYLQENTVFGTLKVGTTTNTDDSIELSVDKSRTIEGDKVDNGSLGDTLALVNQLDTTSDREFNIDKVDTYSAGDDLGETTSGNFSINGTEEDGNRSIVDLKTHSGFELPNKTTLNINDTKLTGNETLVTVSNSDAVINLENTEIDGNFDSEVSYGLNISGTSDDSTTLNGTVDNAEAVLTNSNLKFNTDTFENASLDAQSGTIHLNNGQIDTYEIQELTSAAEALYNIDIDVSGEESYSDVLNIGDGSSGTVTISSINFINGFDNDKEFKVQVLDGATENTQLALAPSLQSGAELGTAQRDIDDIVAPKVHYTDIFNKYYETGKVVGTLTLAQTETENDSIEFKGETIWNGDKNYNGPLGDTLGLVNRLETEEDREFNFDAPDNVYKVTDNLGVTSEGEFSINGVTDGENRSTIDAQNHDLFVLDNNTELNITDTKISNASTIATGSNPDAVINLNNVDFTGNDGGIKIAGSVNISGNSTFENNGDGIEVTSETSIITLNAEGSEITLKDKLTGVDGAKLDINGGTVNIERQVTNLDTTLNVTTVNLKSENLLDGCDLRVSQNGESTVNVVNNATNPIRLDNFTLQNNLNMEVDVDLENKSMDRILANHYDVGNNFVNVSHMNMLSDTERLVTIIPFAEEGLKNNVRTDITEVAYSPIWKYSVEYDKIMGNFIFTRGAGQNPNDASAYNPSVLASSVSAQLGGYMAMIDTYDYAFMHMDMRMLQPSSVRLSQSLGNKYAISDSRAAKYNLNQMTSNGIWYKPYTSYDSVNLKHGPKVRSFSYGNFVGGDTEVHQFNNGFEGVFSAYASYNGSHQSYSGNSIYQNGGNLGVTGTLYKGNFFTGLTVSAGASVAEAKTMYGSEDFPMFMAGVANKTGYNFEFKEGRYIIQPSLLLSYTFVNSFDYTNAAGIKIKSDPLNAIQISPNVKFVMNTKNGWQPYATIGMNWNIMDDTKFKANDTALPELSVKPYFQYGVGIQKKCSDRFTAWGQILLRNGGRNGVAATAGFRWAFGKGGNEKTVIKNSGDKLSSISVAPGGKKIIKQMSESQKITYKIKNQNTTKTVSVGILKSLQ